MTKQGINKIKLWVFISNTTIEEYTLTFSSIIYYIDIVKSFLLLAHEVGSFIKDIIDLLYTPVVCKVRNILTNSSDTSTQYCYNRLLSEKD